jgi:polysaccharide deacetylase family protein (PEP-CTERM system associated)
VNQSAKTNKYSATSHLLSFDVEEYFQVESASGIYDCTQWDAIQKRLAPAVDKILHLLADHQTSATFFILGWVAQHERQLVEQIAEQGHEIASHGMSHRMLNRLNPGEFRRELLDSRRLLEDISGKPVIGYRAPTFSITRNTAWAIDVLAETGFEYDSSIFPVRHDRYGVPEAPSRPHFALGPGAGKILEIPPLTLPLRHINIPVGGGGYLRLLPARLIGLALKKAQSRNQTAMIYLHPWEFDPDQPVLPMRRLSRWRHRVGLRRTEAKLSWLLQQFRFCGVAHVFEDLKAAVETIYTYGSPDSTVV